jgi:hypothetical protein
VTGLSTFSTPIQYSFGVPSQSNKKKTRNKRDANREGGSQTIFLHADDMILYLRGPKASTKKTIRNHKLI